MKKIIALGLALFCVLGLIACDNKSGKDFDKADTYSFRAKVLEAYDDYLLVEPLAGSKEINSSDKILVSLKNKTTSWSIPNVSDLINVVYDGIIMETYPAMLGEVYKVEILETKSVEDDTVKDGKSISEYLIQENGNQYLILPISKSRVHIDNRYKEQLDNIDVDLLKAAEESITDKMSAYTGKPSFDFQLDYSGYLCLCTEWIIDIEPPNIYIDDNGETINSGCDIDHKHIFFSERITADNKTVKDFDIKYTCDFSKYPTNADCMGYGEIAEILDGKLLIVLGAYKDKIEFGEVIWLICDESEAYSVGQIVTYTFRDVKAPNKDGELISIIALSVYME